jgi:dihydrofolate reductase
VRRIRYSVAMSLDGYIAGPKGEADWITMDPDFDFSGLFNQFDTILIGRRTFEPMAAASRASMPGMKTIVFSKTLRPEDYPGVLIVAEDQMKVLASLKASSGKDIWLFGGGKLFRSLAEAGMVDTVEVSIMPILLGAGIPLAPDISKWVNLSLVNHRGYSSGAVSLEYSIRRLARNDGRPVVL